MASFANLFAAMEGAGFFLIIVGVLIFAALMGVLMKIKIFGEHVWINLLVSATVAILFATTIKAVNFATIFVPILIAIVLVILFIILALKFMGAGDLKAGPKASLLILIVIVVIIVVGFMSYAITSPETVQTAEDLNQPANISHSSEDVMAKLTAEGNRVFWNPAVIGIIVLLSIFVVVSFLIVRK